MRLALGKVNWLPEYAKDRLRSFSHFHTSKQDELIVTSDKTRSQSKNVQDCYDKLVTAIKQSVSVKKQADQDTIAKIETL
jgi:protein subunit release factor B